jgi:hypothetical protein
MRHRGRRTVAGTVAYAVAPALTPASNNAHDAQDDVTCRDKGCCGWSERMAPARQSWRLTGSGGLGSVPGRRGERPPTGGRRQTGAQARRPSLLAGGSLSPSSGRCQHPRTEPSLSRDPRQTIARSMVGPSSDRSRRGATRRPLRGCGLDRSSGRPASRLLRDDPGDPCARASGASAVPDTVRTMV